MDKNQKNELRLRLLEDREKGSTTVVQRVCLESSGENVLVQAILPLLIVHELKHVAIIWAKALQKIEVCFRNEIYHRSIKSSDFRKALCSSAKLSSAK